MAGLFVTGTDTDVGKTFVTRLLARGLREAGIDVGVMKPAETGVPPEGPMDARALIAAAGVDDPVELVCPLRFDLPAAPEASARFEGRTVELEPVLDAWATLSARHAGDAQHQFYVFVGGKRGQQAKRLENKTHALSAPSRELSPS